MLATEVGITSSDECGHFPVGHTTRQHPKTAIRMNPLDALHPKHVDCVLDPLRDDVGRLHFIVLDVDHADTELGFRLEFLEGIQKSN